MDNSKSKKNLGEQNEIFLKAYLLKHFTLKQEIIGAPKDIKFISDINFGPKIDVPAWKIEYEKFLETKDYAELKKIFPKSKASYKADILINDVTYSIKFDKAANPAIVNHTNREGFLRACNRTDTNIEILDKIINKYWELRMHKIISEDIKNSDPQSPFRSYKEDLARLLEYFIFEGTGSKNSAFPANKLLSFTDPFNPSTYKILSKRQTIDDIWDHLVFSIRSKKGMPKKYDSIKHKTLEPWVRNFPTEEPRGALHVRVAKH